MSVRHHGSGGAEDEPGERVRPVPLWAISESEEDRRDNSERLAEKHDPFWIDPPRGRGREAGGKGDDSEREPIATASRRVSASWP